MKIKVISMKGLDFLKNELEKIYTQVCEKEKRDLLFSQNLSKNLNRLGKVRKILRKVLPQEIKKTISFYLRNKNQNLYEVSSSEKKWAIDFLFYIVEENPDIPYDFFSKEDHKEITKFLRNKILIALFDYIPKNELFDENDFKKQKEWEDLFKKIKSKKEKDITNLWDLNQESLILSLIFSLRNTV